MKFQHGKDVAGHSGPESCGGPREGVAEALTGETGGSAIEPRNQEGQRR
jgi:RNA-directed DNA polymerase